MKRAVLILVLLTVAVALPPLYSQWSESRRIKQIQEVKQQARTVFGDRVETVLSELESSEPPSVVILYTGGTKSHLEPCGCYQEQSGGLPRRAYVVEQFRRRGFPTLLVDAGNIFDGKEEIDAKRCEVNLKAMSTMEYNAVALSESDLSYDEAYLSRQHAVATFPFLAPDAVHEVFTQPFVIEHGQHTIAFVAGAAYDKAVSQANVVVALGDLRGSEHIDVVIRPDEIEATESEDGTLYIGCKPEGKTLGMLALWLDTNGKLARYADAQLALTGEVNESESIRQLLTDFYQSVATENTTQDTTLFTEQLLEKQQGNGYASATACQ